MTTRPAARRRGFEEGRHRRRSAARRLRRRRSPRTGPRPRAPRPRRRRPGPPATAGRPRPPSRPPLSAAGHAGAHAPLSASCEHPGRDGGAGRARAAVAGVRPPRAARGGVCCGGRARVSRGRACAHTNTHTSSTHPTVEQGAGVSNLVFSLTPGLGLCSCLYWLLGLSFFVLVHTVSCSGICQGLSWQHLNQPCVAG